MQSTIHLERVPVIIAKKKDSITTPSEETIENRVRELLVGEALCTLMRSLNNLVVGPCSEKLHLQLYLEMLWSETGYFGLLGKIL